MGISFLSYLKQHLVAFADEVYWCGLECRTLHSGIFFNGIFLSCWVPTFRSQKVVKHGGHRGISFLFIDLTRSTLSLYDSPIVTEEL